MRWSLRYGGFIMLFFGLAAGYVMYPTLERAISENKWAETLCTVDAVELVTDEYAVSTLNLSYRYTVDGVERSGSAYETKSNISRDTSFYQSALRTLKKGAPVKCYFDPAHPESVVIQRTSYSDGAAIFVPVLFILLGLGKLLFQYRTRNG